MSNYKVFEIELGNCTNYELVEKFNNQIWNPGWGTAKANYLDLVRKEFIKRDIDYSSVSDGENLLLNQKVKLINDVLFLDER